jgi:hypothetical protein
MASTDGDDSAPPQESIAPPPSATTALSWLQAWQLLSQIGYGRLVFTRNGLPAVQVVQHVIDEDQIVVPITLQLRRSGGRGDAVAYQCDDIRVDSDRLSGWSVLVTGLASLLTDPARLQRCQRSLPPSMTGTADPLIAITPEIVTGHHLYRC